MGKVLLHARVTPATGGCSGTRVLACTAEGSLYVRSDNTIASASASISENMAYLAGHAVDHNAGAVGDGTQRVVLANNTYALVSATNHASAALADPAAVAISGTTEGAANGILASADISTYRGVTVWVKNVGGGNAAALSHVYVYVSRNGTDWTLVDAIKNAVELLCDSLAATKIGIAFTITTNPGWQYIKATATVAASDTTAFGSVSYQM